MRVRPIITVWGTWLLCEPPLPPLLLLLLEPPLELPPLPFGGFMSRLRSLQLRGLMVSIQSRSPSSRLGTVESAPTDMLTKEAKSSNSSLQEVMSIISNFVTPFPFPSRRFCGLEDDTSPLCCDRARRSEVVTTWLPLLPLRLMDKVVVEEMDPMLEGELKLKLRSVMPLLLLLEDRTGSMVSEEPMETVVRPGVG